MKFKNSVPFAEGMKASIPIALGYLSVSFGIGITAVAGGLPMLAAVLMSLTNLTSAGQVAGLGIIAAGGAFAEMALTQFTINLRYFLMSLALSQKLSPGYTTLHRLTTSFAVTDEIFGVASSREGDIEPSFMYGIAILPIFGWTLGTFLGAVAGSFLPQAVCDALGIAIYGMFVAIVLPPAKKNKGVLFAALVAVAVSLILAYVPVFSFVTSGFSIIICAVIASLTAAFLFPIPTEEEGEAHE